MDPKKLIKMVEAAGPDLLSQGTPAAVEGFAQGYAFALLVIRSGMGGTPQEMIETGLAAKPLYEAVKHYRRENNVPEGWLSGISPAAMAKGREAVGQVASLMTTTLEQARQFQLMAISMVDALGDDRATESGRKGFTLEELLGAQAKEVLGEVPPARPPLWGGV